MGPERSAFHLGQESSGSARRPYTLAQTKPRSFFACNQAAEHTFCIALTLRLVRRGGLPGALVPAHGTRRLHPEGTDALLQLGVPRRVKFGWPRDPSRAFETWIAVAELWASARDGSLNKRRQSCREHEGKTQHPEPRYNIRLAPTYAWARLASQQRRRSNKTYGKAYLCLRRQFD